MHLSRRSFVKKSAAVSLSFIGLRNYLTAAQSDRVISPYGPLIPDPAKLLDLPKGFSYSIISKAGDKMDDGYMVPGKPDGMATFPGKDGRVILVRNHELQPGWKKLGPFPKGTAPTPEFRTAAYDSDPDGNSPHLGGTSTIVFNPKSGKVEKQFLSLAGTDRNCAGGTTPWGSWITCEEPADLTSKRGQKHGYCFEVFASDDGKLQKAIPLKALGRFRHEAIAVDPRSGIIYLTEDVNDGLLYRFIPKSPKNLHEGKLQALALTEKTSADTRNYKKSPDNIKLGGTHQIKWIDLDQVEAPDNDLRFRGHKAGAAMFARGEGIIYDDGKIYICCTDGGPSRQGQVYILTPDPKNTSSDSLELFLQPEASDLLTNGDNICSSPWGDLIICEDLCAEHRGNRPHLRGITPEGKIYTLGKNAKNASEFAGSCFSADGSILFVNMQGLGLTLAITGPWQKSSKQ